ncbi:MULTISPECIES: SIMPL domain-containing protein [unclassified Beijerinckia]|uniref:SIMPL domain-containing protein n=1 Tax=unclassified Beijerinckia TaxID=2638183 RepID=UPI000895E470|nr:MULTISPECIES: SIMPL domain-containing protein [unclassified Beijerinckia]MDH7795247.1 uncharacterized protein YggE [Beijerinckia sp. GAS462]SEB93563.1 hypothetical protein SAMN05443249_1520 [Beijerinckia sp. 28-YEA-48]
MTSLKLSVLGAALLASLSASVAVKAQTIATVSKDTFPQITITGTAAAREKPDIARIRLGIRIERPSAKEATDETSRIAGAVVLALRGQRIADLDIRTTNSSVARNYDIEYGPDRREISRKPRGFVAQHHFSIQVRDIDKAGALVRLALDKGANEYDGTDFLLEKREERQLALNNEALRKARTQAESYAATLNVKLGRLVAVYEGAPPVEPEGYADLPRRAPTPNPLGAPIPLEPGEVTVKATMSATWELAPTN